MNLIARLHAVMTSPSSELTDIKTIKQITEEEHRVEWSYDATKELLKIYDEKSDMLDTGIINTHKKLWELTSKALAKKGYYYTGGQCENKWKALKRAYKTKLERVQKFGTYKRTCPFEYEIAEILSKRPNDSITRSYSFKVHAMKKEDDLFTNINLNEPPGFTKENFKQEEEEYDEDSRNITFIDDNQEHIGIDEHSMEHSNQNTYTIIQQDSDPVQSALVEEISDLKRTIVKQGRMNTQVLRDTSKVQEKILDCLEQAANKQARALELEETKVNQQNEIINQMKIQNELLQSLIEKFA